MFLWLLLTSVSLERGCSLYCIFALGLFKELLFTKQVIWHLLHVKNTHYIGYLKNLNLLRPSKQTKTRFAICAKIPDVLMKYQTVASDMLPLTSTINDMGVIFTSLLTFDNPISFLVSHTLYIAFRIVFSLLLARSYYYNIKFKRKDQDFILMIYLKHFKLW